MPASLSNQPVPYDAAVEQPQPHEAEAATSVNESMRGILETTWRDYGHAVRSVHAKSHGLLEGELRVLDGLPAHLAQGLFARPATYPAVLRVSTNPGDILDDTVSSPRGLAIKVIGVEGDRLPGSEGDTTQDFVMVNGPAFVAPDVQAFGKNLKLLAATTDTGQAWKKAFPAALRGAAGALAATTGVESPAVKALGGQPLTHPLGETFYTQTPFRYGDYVAKLSLAPVSPELAALKDAPVDLTGKPNGLREAVIDFFRARGGTWELRVQLRTNPDTMPVEDASAPWSEDESSYVAVAQLSVRPQPAWSEARAREVDDGLSFSPWHGLAAHRPLGSVNRARKEAYALSAGFRAEHNRCPVGEPRAPMGLSGQPASAYGTAPGREGHRPRTPDARPGTLGQPLNPTARRIAAGAAGGLAAGTLLTLVMLGMEAARAEPSELVTLKRRTVKRAGGREPRERAEPTVGEQLLSHGGHLALSAAAGVAYGAAKPDNVSPAVAGTVFGLGFWALAYGLVGPALRVTPKPQDDTPASLAQHGLLHVLFGVTTAVVADRVARRI